MNVIHEGLCPRPDKLQDGFSFYDVFRAPGSGAIFANAMQDMSRCRV